MTAWTTQDDLCANRRRFQREGVAVMTGQREAIAPLQLCLPTLQPIYVRPAWRIEDRKPTLVETLLERIFRGS